MVETTSEGGKSRRSYSLRFAQIVFVEDSRSGGIQAVGSVREAEDCLRKNWPKSAHGARYAAAIQACRGSRDGELPTERARRALLEAAREVGILVREGRPATDLARLFPVSPES